MTDTNSKLQNLYTRIPRRHSPDNVKEIYTLLDSYEEILITMEADARYEKQVPRFFEVLEPIRALIKKSNDNKASKKTKDVLFDEASGTLKDRIQEALQL